jgi:hypothetical protein
LIDLWVGYGIGYLLNFGPTKTKQKMIAKKRMKDHAGTIVR